MRIYLYIYGYLPAFGVLSKIEQLEQLESSSLLILYFKYVIYNNGGITIYNSQVPCI